MTAAWLLWLTAAFAEEPWWVGRPVVGVSLEAPSGGLPTESLDPLLRVRQGEPLDPAAVRTDLTTLFQVGPFAAVEARVEPWDNVDEDGNAVRSALLTYFVWPAPRVDRVRVEGAHEVSRRVVLDAADITVGQPWFADQDKAPAEARIRAELAARGYGDAAVWVGSWSPDAGRTEVVINVSEGEASRLARLEFGGDLSGLFPDVEEKDLTRLAAAAGLKVGRPFSGETVAAARDAVRERLASMDRPLFGERTGWLSARVTPLVANSDDGWVARFAVELGSRLALDVEGLGLSGERRAVAALGIDARLRLTRGFLDEASGDVTSWLEERGWAHATATVERVDTAADTETLVVRAVRGPRARLRQGRFPGWVGVRFEGNETVDDTTLMAVLDDGVELLRLDRYTPGAMQQGLDVAEAWYRSLGRPDASLALREVLEDPRRRRFARWLWSPIRAVTGREPTLRLTPVVDVVEGRAVTLLGVSVRGAADGVGPDGWNEEISRLIGGPGSLVAVEALGARIEAAHRAAGWLEASARARLLAVEGELDRVSAVIEVTQGPLVLLRSVVVSGPRITRPALIRREAALVLGEPLTEPDIERAREDLYDLGIFRSVSMDLLGDGDLRDLVLSVSEKPRWAFETGFGLATDQGVRTFGRIDRRNLFGIAHRLELYGQVGLDWRTESLLDWVPNFRTPEWRVVVQYRAPRFPVRNEDVVVDALVGERRIERTWSLDRRGGGLALTTHLAGDWKVIGSARLEERQLEDVDEGALLVGEPWETILSADPTLPTLFRPQETASVVVVADRRDDPVLPTRGLLASVSAEVAPGLIRANDVVSPSFLKAVFRGNTWTSLPFVTWHVAVEGGWIGSLDGHPPPLEDRFMLGGTASLRGFPRAGIGPRNLVAQPDIDWPDGLDPLIDQTVRDDAERWVPTGGDALAVSTLEALVPLPVLGLSAWDGYSAAVFVDVGNVWLVGPGDADTAAPDVAGLLPPLRVGTGAGLRASTPVGPLQFDLAVNPVALTATGARQNLLLDAFGEPRFRLHLTLGAL